MNNNNYDVFFWISFLANVAQLKSYQLNVEQTDNDQIMKHLEKQDMILDEQTNIYLKEIVAQNQEIISLLKGEK